MHFLIQHNEISKTHLFRFLPQKKVFICRLVIMAIRLPWYTGWKQNLTNRKRELKQNCTLQQQQQQQQQETTTLRNKWVTFTYFSPLVRKISNLFRQTELEIAFRATNTIQQQLNAKQTHDDPSGIYELKCKTCKKVYVGQSDRAIGVRFKEHMGYMRSNNSTSVYAAHILDNRYDYGTKEDTLKLLKKCQKGKHMQTFHQKKVLINEQQTGDKNPLFETAKTLHSTWLQPYTVQRTTPQGSSLTHATW